VSQNNIRNNQNFNICNDIRRHRSTNNIKRNVEPGGSTLSRSIFAFLENRDNTNVDSNPYQNFHESQKFGPKKIFKLAQCLPPRCLASPDTWPPTDRAGDGRGRSVSAASSTRRASDSRTGNSASNTNIASSPDKSLASAFLLGSLPRPPRPPPPCCPSIIRIFSPHLLDTCMNEEIDK